MPFERTTENRPAREGEHGDSHRRADVLPRQLAAPPEEQYAQAPLPAWIYSALLGNGRLLVCLDAAGNIAQLFYPHIDSGPHVRTCFSGVQITRTIQDANQAVEERKMLWLTAEGWTHEMRYLPGTAVLVIRSQHNQAGLELERTLAVDPERDLLACEVRLKNLSEAPAQFDLVTCAGFDFELRRSGNCSFFQRERSLLVAFAGNCYLAIGSDAPVRGFDCDKSAFEMVDTVFQNADKGTFAGHEYAIGQTSNALCHDFGLLAPQQSSLHEFHLYFGSNLPELLALVSSRPTARATIEKATSWWQEQLAPYKSPIKTPEVSGVYERSLMVLQLLSDRRSGAIIASPEVDPEFRFCGGYGMCWPRDGAYNAHALDIVGRHQEARAFYDWSLDVQDPSGVWYQRYYADGRLAPTWGLIQFDETGAVVWAICQHIQATNDLDYAKTVYPQLTLACDYMQNQLDKETGLAPVTKDLWEERDAISTYACACTWGAFEALSQLAMLLQNHEHAERWRVAARDLKAAIETHLWDAEAGRFRRGMNLKVYTQSPAAIGSVSPDTQRYDSVIDASLLALSVPFGVFPASDPRMLATARAMETALTSPIGGVMRYEHDNYRNGNPWIICTLWLAWFDLLAGRTNSARRLYAWSLKQRTALDLLAEQIDGLTGEPAWVVPLGWSHAMFLLVSHAFARHDPFS